MDGLWHKIQKQIFSGRILMQKVQVRFSTFQVLSETQKFPLLTLL